MSGGRIVQKRELGQHFLVDPNILGVIERLAALDPDDVVLEVGAGLGVLTTYLADRVDVVHAVEVDRQLVPHLEAELAGRENVRLHVGDALALDLSSLRPPPGKLVANLPYAIATPLVADSLDGLPSVARWCVMVQREVADRFVAGPGTKAYGAVSVLLQLTARPIGLHPVARTCFRPPPNVESAIVALVRERSWGEEYPWLKRVVQGAFAHRRKTLANSLVLAGVSSRDRAAAALARLGAPADARAESLAPGAFLELAEQLR
ncbi:MAG: 16S rRNA (adenine(1518)-N(6)/adenine(1519)-N(6))-dimethyltransferase RsmA [Thermoleophilia bacterium]